MFGWLLEVVFCFFVTGMLCYFEYLNLKMKNQRVLCQENFEVIVNNLNNAIISEAPESQFGYCNELGLQIIKAVSSMICQRDSFDQENVNNQIYSSHLDKLKSIEYHF